MSPDQPLLKRVRLPSRFDNSSRFVATIPRWCRSRLKLIPLSHARQPDRCFHNDSTRWPVSGRVHQLAVLDRELFVVAQRAFVFRESLPDAIDRRADRLRQQMDDLLRSELHPPY